jgi:putative exosortase-associated protein (TIGR04073 family)
MKRHARSLTSLLLAGLFFTAMAAQAAEPTESYGQIFGRKLLSGLGNLVTAPAEIPKNIIIVNNETNVVWGVAGGTLKGLINTGGRMGVGLLDLITAPIPTYPIVYPAFVWEDFYAETTYGPAFVGESTK